MLSHSVHKDLIAGVNGRAISLAQLMHLFKSCQTIQGKHKLFFIDACRGQHADHNPPVRATTWPPEADLMLALSTTL